MAVTTICNNTNERKEEVILAICFLITLHA